VNKKIVITLVVIAWCWSCGPDAGKPIKVGILHSLTGTMAISETSVKDATLLAIWCGPQGNQFVLCPIPSIGRNQNGINFSRPFMRVGVKNGQIQEDDNCKKE